MRFPISSLLVSISSFGFLIAGIGELVDKKELRIFGMFWLTFISFSVGMRDIIEFFKARIWNRRTLANLNNLQEIIQEA